MAPEMFREMQNPSTFSLLEYVFRLRAVSRDILYVVESKTCPEQGAIEKTYA
jgi:hypothetical protein